MTLEQILLESVKTEFDEHAMCIPRNGKHESIKLSDPTTWYYRFEVSPDCLHNFTDKLAAHLSEKLVSVEAVVGIIDEVIASDMCEYSWGKCVDRIRALCGAKGGDLECVKNAKDVGSVGGSTTQPSENLEIPDCGRDLDPQSGIEDQCNMGEGSSPCGGNNTTSSEQSGNAPSPTLESEDLFDFGIERAWCPTCEPCRQELSPVGYCECCGAMYDLEPEESPDCLDCKRNVTGLCGVHCPPPYEEKPWEELDGNTTTDRE